MGVFLSVADAIKTALNSGSFSKEFTAARGYDTRLVLAELGLRGLVVRVCPGQLASENENRGDTLETATADIAIFYKFEQDDMADGKVKGAAIDPYLAADVTIITRECSGSFTAGSRGRTKPFTTIPSTATG